MPLSSKIPIEYRKINARKISEQEKMKKKQQITNIIEINHVYGFKALRRWATIMRMRKVSVLRVDFFGSIGSIKGEDMDLLMEKIRKEF